MMNLQWSLERPPSGLFRGQNFMTPEILGYARGTWEGRSCWVELSRGAGIFGGGTIYGVTVNFDCAGGPEGWRMKQAGKIQDNPSRCFHSRLEAEEYVQAIIRGAGRAYLAGLLPTSARP